MSGLKLMNGILISGSSTSLKPNGSLEVEREIEDMEEDQDLLLYYSLMEFRHRVMLDYIKPFGEDTSQLEFSELLEDIEGNQYKLTGLLEYYFNFFRGMYEFKQKMFVSAMMYYKRAEKNLALVSDDIEKAEFAFKMAEIFYNLKQTYVSMSLRRSGIRNIPNV